ncbi:M23 family metallopeptidase [bacterium]|nr:M23 family metallopeptidase [bacterium]
MGCKAQDIRKTFDTVKTAISSVRDLAKKTENEFKSSSGSKSQSQGSGKPRTGSKLSNDPDNDVAIKVSPSDKSSDSKQDNDSSRAANANRARAVGNAAQGGLDKLNGLESTFNDIAGIFSDKNDSGKIASGGGSKPGSNSDSSSSPSEPSESGAKGRFGAPVIDPMPTRAASEFGPRNVRVGHKNHTGVDIPTPNDTPLHALGDGVVTAVEYKNSPGRFLQIRYDNGIESVFAHLPNGPGWKNKIYKKAGDRVKMGEVVALSDNSGTSTGAHLHMGIKKNGKFVNPRSIPGIQLPPKR